jgi:hypothetical protein
MCSGVDFSTLSSSGRLDLGRGNVTDASRLPFLGHIRVLVHLLSQALAIQRSLPPKVFRECQFLMG